MITKNKFTELCFPFLALISIAVFQVFNTLFSENDLSVSIAVSVAYVLIIVGGSFLQPALVYKTTTPLYHVIMAIPIIAYIFDFDYYCTRAVLSVTLTIAILAASKIAAELMHISLVHFFIMAIVLAIPLAYIHCSSVTMLLVFFLIVLILLPVTNAECHFCSRKTIIFAFLLFVFAICLYYNKSEYFHDKIYAIIKQGDYDVYNLGWVRFITNKVISQTHIFSSSCSNDLIEISSTFDYDVSFNVLTNGFFLYGFICFFQIIFSLCVFFMAKQLEGFCKIYARIVGTLYLFRFIINIFAIFWYGSMPISTPFLSEFLPENLFDCISFSLLLMFYLRRKTDKLIIEQKEIKLPSFFSIFKNRLQEFISDD